MKRRNFLRIGGQVAGAAVLGTATARIFSPPADDAEFIAQGPGQVQIRRMEFDLPRRRGPHKVGAAVPEFRRHNRGPADGGAFHARPPGIAGFGLTVHQNGFDASLAAAF